MNFIEAVARSTLRSVGRVRAVMGQHAPSGQPLVHVRCGGGNERIATVEHGDQGLQTFWLGRRFPGIPRLDCPGHGRLELDTAKLADKLRAARRDGKPRTLKARPLS